jgi:hypothetical protein
MRGLLMGMCVALLVGCGNPKVEHLGSGSSGGAGGAAGSGASSGSIGSSSGSGSGSSGSSSAGATSGSSGSYAGVVSFSDIEFGALGSRKSVNAAFGDARVAMQFNPADCTLGTLDAKGCCVRQPGSASGSSGSSGSTGGGSSGSTGNAPSAGVIALTADSAPLGSLTPSASTGLYPPATLAWNPGQTLGVNAAGDVVHAFSGSVVAPTPVTINNPAVGFPPPAVSTQAALQITWSGGSAQAANSKTLVGVVSQDQTRSVLCYFDTHSPSAFTIASSSMAIFTPPQGQQAGGVVIVGVGVLSTATSDNASVTLAALTAAGGPVQFQ